MGDDREVVRGVWEGKIPVSFSLAAEEVGTLNVPEPYYLILPRLLYFPLVTEKVRRHFAQFRAPSAPQTQIWLEYNGAPIKWNYPIGLWFDLHAEGVSLPWSLTLHFDSFPPEEELIRCPSASAIRSHFMSVLKEADALKHKGHVINSMQEKEHSQLWQGLQNDKFDQFWSVNKKLMEWGGTEGFRHIPVRCYTPHKFALQRLIRPIDETTGKWTTLEETLQQFFPNFHTSNQRVIVHGIEAPLNSPIQWLSEHLSYPDNFLHLVVLPAKESFENNRSSTLLEQKQAEPPSLLVPLNSA